MSTSVTRPRTLLVKMRIHESALRAFVAYIHAQFGCCRSVFYNVIRHNRPFIWHPGCRWSFSPLLPQIPVGNRHWEGCPKFGLVSVSLLVVTCAPLGCLRHQAQVQENLHTIGYSLTPKEQFSLEFQTKMKRII